MKRILSHPLGIGISVFVVVIAFGFVLRSFGYYVQNFSIVAGGDVFVRTSDVDARVFLDNKKLNLTASDNLILVENVAPGEHSLLVFNDEYWPWKKDIVVHSNETTTINPFLVKRNPSVEVVNDEDPRFNTLRAEVLSTSIPSADAPLTSSDGTVSVWVAGDSLVAQSNAPEESRPTFFCDDDGLCANTKEIVTSVTPIRGVDFYKDRSDVLIIAMSNGVFVIEIDSRGGTQNFQQIYRSGSFPDFKKLDNERISVVDGTFVFIVDL